jgi:ABC-2 type transport system permease protein
MIDVEFFLMSFKNAFVYRSSVIFSILGSVFWVLVQIALWSFIYQGEPEMITYMTAYVIVANIVGMFYSRDMMTMIGGKVASGNFAYDLIRPVNIITMSYRTLLGSLTSGLILRALPQVLIFLPVLIKSVALSNILPSLAAILIGHFLYIILYALLGFLAFIVIEIWPFRRLLDDTIRFVSGSVVPLALFPTWLQRLSDFLPFKYLYDFPLRLLLNQLEGSDVIKGLLISAAWTAALGILLLLSYRSAVNKCTVQGG